MGYMVGHVARTSDLKGRMSIDIGKMGVVMI
jgi:hypothetical protein